MYARTIRPDELYHFGIKGMRWGIRRFQNKDGTLTSVGKARSKKERSFAKGVETVGYNTQFIKSGKDKARKSAGQVIAGETKRSIEATRDATSTVARTIKDTERYRQQEALNKEVKKLSDDELRGRINRLRLEQQYKELNTQTVRTGADKAVDILSITGDVAAIGLSVATTAATLNTLRNK